MGVAVLASAQRARPDGRPGLPGGRRPRARLRVPDQPRETMYC